MNATWLIHAAVYLTRWTVIAFINSNYICSRGRIYPTQHATIDTITLCIILTVKHITLKACFFTCITKGTPHLYPKIVPFFRENVPRKVRFSHFPFNAPYPVLEGLLDPHGGMSIPSVRLDLVLFRLNKVTIQVAAV